MGKRMSMMQWGHFDSLLTWGHSQKVMTLLLVLTKELNKKEYSKGNQVVENKRMFPSAFNATSLYSHVDCISLLIKKIFFRASLCPILLC